MRPMRVRSSLSQHDQTRLRSSLLNDSGMCFYQAPITSCSSALSFFCPFPRLLNLHSAAYIACSLACLPVRMRLRARAHAFFLARW